MQLFKQMYYDKKNILEVTATTTVPMTAALRQKLTDKLEKVSGKSVILHEKLDKSILGGIVLRYGNTQIDSSVKTKLDKIKAQIDSAIL
jgi:F-type H+-transporting ATPase subunit delta